MNMHFVTGVQPKNGYVVHITFDDGKEFDFDVKPYLDKGVFQELKNTHVFRKVSIDPIAKTISWPNGLDFCPDTLYQKMIAQ